MKYRRVIVTTRSGPEGFELVEEDIRPPLDSEVRVRVLAAPVSLPDVEARYGRTPFPPRVPFTPGYAVIGDIDAVGNGVQSAAPGDRVAGLTIYGGYSEVVYLRERQIIPVPVDADPVSAAPLILNYIVAYQCLHRSANVKDGSTVLIIGASGGIGTAFLQLGDIVGLNMYALASESKHAILRKYGAIPIDYKTQDYRQIVRTFEPDGIDAIFDGVGGDYIRNSFTLLRRGGSLVTYANPLSLRRTFIQLGQVLLLNFLPNGRSASYYSTGQSRINRRPFLQDWAELFKLLQDGQIKPIILKTYSIDQAAEANEILEAGNVIGNIVLTGPGLR